MSMQSVSFSHIFRCFVGANSPAQLPDCNIIVEAVFVKLCALYPNPVRQGGIKISQFNFIVRAYKHIRECILSNAEVMQQTTLQLPQCSYTYTMVSDFCT